MEKNKTKDDTIRLIVLIILITVVAFIAVLFIFGNKETVTESQASEYPFLALNCKTSKLSTVTIFNTRNPKNEAHEIRGVFNKDHTLRNLFYMYEGEYANENDANAASSGLHADYNIYMGKLKQNQSSFTPVFSYIKNKAKFSLYADEKNLNNENSAVFLLDSSARPFTIDNIKMAYEAKNFICTIEEKNN